MTTDAERPGPWFEDPSQDDEPAGPRHTPARKVTALIVAVFLAIITALTMGYSLFKAPPTPARTAPLPAVIPHQGAVR